MGGAARTAARGTGIANGWVYDPQRWGYTGCMLAWTGSAANHPGCWVKEPFATAVEMRLLPG